MDITDLRELLIVESKWDIKTIPMIGIKREINITNQFEHIKQQRGYKKHQKLESIKTIKPTKEESKN